MIANKIPPITG